MTEEYCSNCRFKGVDIIDGEEALVCRRYAPHMFMGSGAGWSDQKWPVVSETMWCGEWEEKQ